MPNVPSDVPDLFLNKPDAFDDKSGVSRITDIVI